MIVTFRTLRTQRRSYWDASESLTVSPSLESEWFRCSATAAATRKASSAASSAALVAGRLNWFGRRVAAGAGACASESENTAACRAASSRLRAERASNDDGLVARQRAREVRHELRVDAGRRRQHGIGLRRAPERRAREPALEGERRRARALAAVLRHEAL